MKLFNNHIKWFFTIAAITFATACKKSDNPNDLPDVNPNDYTGKIDGYDRSDQIFP